ncbi:hypothetical protein [Halegenticoccus soli]|uniref:hypothetical protein n=1 Tax=Halegenticoccus soli TaxID=1985678 RepID=UPI0018ED237B|nr:hypothetical protein [Halegenticoccus soli]
MSINITYILKESAGRSIERNGLLLMGIFFALSLANGLLGLGVARWAASREFAPAAVQANPFLVVPPVVAGVISLVLGIASLVVSIAAIRVFVSPETDRLPREYFTRNVLWAALNVVVGGIIFGIIVALGFVALIIPGIFLLVSLAFWTVYVAVEDQNFVEGFRNSWALTRGRRLPLLGLGVAVLLLVAIISAVFNVGYLGGDVVGLVFAQLGGAITTVFSTAALATAYNQLTALPETDETPTAGEEPVSPRDAPKGA